MRGLLLFLLLAGAEDRAAVQEMEELAVWCADQRLFGRLQDLYTRLLVLDPDHARARRRLGYTRRKKGSWVRTRQFKPSKDLNPDALPEYLLRLRAIAESYASRVLAPVESGEATPDEAHTITGRVLALDPDHARTRALRNEVRHETGWEMEETGRARERLGALRVQATAARESAKRGRPGKLTDEEKALGVEFGGVLRTESLRLASRVSLAEVPELTRAAGAARGFFEPVVGVPVPSMEKLTILVFANPVDFATALRSHPKLPEGRRRAAAMRASVWIPSTETVLIHGASTSRRGELCARVVIDRLNFGAFGLDERTGWAWEGLGLYLGYRVTGERSQVAARRTRYTRSRRLPAAETKLWTQLMTAGRNWFSLADAEARSGRGMEFALLLAKDARTMRARDLLFSYALVAFLVEAKQDQNARILRKIGGGADSAAVLEDELGLSLRALELRLADWVAERAQLGDGAAR
ncbi:MAG: hypothetical protein ACYS0E_08695 [Planctomycetota bacterium]|jgi:hypothetical protein